MTATQTLKMNNPYSKLGLKRRPTYDEVINLISENETITGKLPNRDATFFKGSPEGSFFDGSDSLEVLKDEQERLLLKQMGELLLRQNARRNGTTFHTQRRQSLPATSPTIEQPAQPMDVEAQAQTQSAPTTQAQTQSAPTAPAVSNQSTQLNTELQQRRNITTQRHQAVVMNHRGEIFQQNKPTITERIHHINPPRSFAPVRPQNFPMSDSDEALMGDTRNRKRRQDIPSSSNQPLPAVEMDVNASSKRGSPETQVEPRGKAGRPKVKYTDTRPNAEKREGDEPESEVPRKKSRKKGKGRQNLSLGTGARGNDDEGDDEQPERRRGVRKTIQKPVSPSTIGIQKLREEFVNANNKNIISKEEYDRFDELYKLFITSKGQKAKKSKIINDARDVYRDVLFKKLKDSFKNQ